MPTTVTSPSGEVYHLFQLSSRVKELSSSIEFSELQNDLGDSFFSQRLYGSDTGNRSWALTLPTLTGTTGASSLVTGVNNEQTTRALYLWDLFCECKVTGKPFVYQDPQNNQYYLVDFADKRMTLQKMFAYLYSAGVEIKQRRIDGETVFNVLKMDAIGYGYDWFNDTNHGSTTWPNISDTSIKNPLTKTGDVVFSANPQNGHNTVRLNGSASTGYLNGSNFSAPIFEIFIVMKMREATFSNNAGILTGTSSARLLVGTSGGTKFQNLFTGQYWLNGVEYELSDMQAPMNTWGVVQVRISGGFDPISSAQFGRDLTTAGTYAKADIGEVVSFAQPVPRSVGRELVEHLQVKWGVGE